MPRWSRFVVPLLLIVAAGYLYFSNFFVELEAVFELAPTHLSVRAMGGSYRDCTLTLDGFSSPRFDIRLGETRIVNIHEFRQWNGTILDTVKMLQPVVEIDMRCDEGRISAKTDNRYREEE